MNWLFKLSRERREEKKKNHIPIYQDILADDLLTKLN